VKVSSGVVATLLMAAVGITACSREDRDRAVDEVDRAANQVGARAVAESFRVALEIRDLDDGERQYDVAVITAVVTGLPGDPDAVGVVDRDGDGADDDGKVQFRSNDESACVTISKTGEDTKVSDGSC
jgi:hypothetical protein